MKRLIALLEIKKWDSWPHAKPYFWWYMRHGFVNIYAGLVMVLSLGRYTTHATLKHAMEHSHNEHLKIKAQEAAEISNGV